MWLNGYSLLIWLHVAFTDLLNISGIYYVTWLRTGEANTGPSDEVEVDWKLVGPPPLRTVNLLKRRQGRKTRSSAQVSPVTEAEGHMGQW